MNLVKHSSHLSQKENTFQGRQRVTNPHMRTRSRFGAFDKEALCKGNRIHSIIVTTLHKAKIELDVVLCGCALPETSIAYPLYNQRKAL